MSRLHHQHQTACSSRFESLAALIRALKDGGDGEALSAFWFVLAALLIVASSLLVALVIVRVQDARARRRAAVQLAEGGDDVGGGAEGGFERYRDEPDMGECGMEKALGE